MYEILAFRSVPERVLLVMTSKIMSPSTLFSHYEFFSSSILVLDLYFFNLKKYGKFLDVPIYEYILFDQIFLFQFLKSHYYCSRDLK